MNLNDLKLLGQAIKKKHPEYANATDEDVGRIILKKYPQYAKEFGQVPLPNLTGADVQATKEETEKLSALAGYVTTKASLTHQIQEVRHSAEVHRTGHELNIRTQEAAITQATAQKVVTELALDKKMDVQTFAAVRLEEEKERIRFEGREKEFAQDILKAERMADIDIKKEDDLMKLYIWTTRVERMFPKEIQAGLQERIFGQIDAIAKIRKEELSEGRTAKLAVAEMLLNSWVRELDELTRAKEEAVSGFDGQEPRGLAEATQPQTSNGEDD